MLAAHPDKEFANEKEARLRERASLSLKLRVLQRKGESL